MNEVSRAPEELEPHDKIGVKGTREIGIAFSSFTCVPPPVTVACEPVCDEKNNIYIYIFVA